MSDTIETVMGFDYGTRKIGVAVGETLTRVARPLCDVAVRANRPDWDRILSLLEDYRIDVCVVGLPLNMDGSRQPLSDLAEAFAKELRRRSTCEVCLIDERLSSVEAKAMIFAEKKPGKKNKLRQRGIVDAYAAKIILDNWFNE